MAYFGYYKKQRRILKDGVLELGPLQEGLTALIRSLVESHRYQGSL